MTDRPSAALNIATETAKGSRPVAPAFRRLRLSSWAFNHEIAGEVDYDADGLRNYDAYGPDSVVELGVRVGFDAAVADLPAGSYRVTSAEMVVSNTVEPSEEAAPWGDLVVRLRIEPGDAPVRQRLVLFPRALVPPVGHAEPIARGYHLEFVGRNVLGSTRPGRYVATEAEFTATPRDAGGSDVRVRLDLIPSHDGGSDA